MSKHKGIYKRGNIWWINYAGPDHRERRESSRSTRFKDAEELRVRRKQEVLEGIDPIAARRMTDHCFFELAGHYLEWAQKQKAFESKRGFVKQFADVFDNFPLRYFTTRAIEEWQTSKLLTSKPATVNRMLATLKHMFTKASEWEMINDEILRRVRRVKLLPVSNRRLRYLSSEECSALIQASSPHLKPIIIAALNTGMRKGEILSLQWDKHVDLRHGFILLDITKSGERREIPINETMRETLSGLIRHLSSQYVFTDIDGNRFKDVKTAFNAACRRAGIKDLRFHDLRHTFASHLIMAGVDLTTVKELLGHKTISMTLRYAHLAPSHKVKAMETLDNILGGKGTAQKPHKNGRRGMNGANITD
ncbi:MAG: site-specific integrase [Candidatus Eisenbacteria bacterium]|nr:site-specific integrase [Candidatus Eisenbacteria bacterium]